MELLKGRLEYLGWNYPWKLVTETAEVNLRPLFEASFKLLDAKGHRKIGASFEYSMDGFSLTENAASKDVLEWKAGEYPFLKKKEGFGFSNLGLHLEMAFNVLNGRQVIFETPSLSTQDIKIYADPKEKTFGLYFMDDNSCKIPAGKEQEICKIGHGADCCIFVSVSGGGFMCEKFNSPMARILLYRLANGNIRARRIGNCALLGRKEDPDGGKRKAESVAEKFKKFCDGKLAGWKVRHRETMPTFVAEGTVKSLTIEDGPLVLRAGWSFNPSIAVRYAAATENSDGSVEICSVGFAGGNTWEFSPPNT